MLGDEEGSVNIGQLSESFTEIEIRTLDEEGEVLTTIGTHTLLELEGSIESLTGNDDIDIFSAEAHKWRVHSCGRNHEGDIISSWDFNRLHHRNRAGVEEE